MIVRTEPFAIVLQRCSLRAFKHAVITEIRTAWRLSRDWRPTTSSVGVQDLLALAAEDLAVYAVANWPGFELAQHHKIIVEKLEAVERGEIDRLMIFTDPRHGESMITSQFFPAWYLGRHPDRYVIGASHGAELSLDFGRRVRNLIADALHQAIFPCRSTEDSSAAHRFNLTAGECLLTRLGANGSGGYGHKVARRQAAMPAA